MAIREERVLEYIYRAVPIEKEIVYYYSSDGAKFSSKADAEERESVLEIFKNFPSLPPKDKDFPDDKWFFIKDGKSLDHLFILHEDLFGRWRERTEIEVSSPCFVKISVDEDEIRISDYISQNDIEEMVRILRAEML